PGLAQSGKAVCKQHGGLLPYLCYRPELRVNRQLGQAVSASGAPGLSYNPGQLGHRGHDTMTAAFKADQPLDLATALERLTADGLLHRQDANQVAGSHRSREQALRHPLVYIAGQQLENAARPGRLLDLDTLTQWLADAAGLQVQRIDPLKIRVAEVTRVMSFEFAKRHGI